MTVYFISSDMTFWPRVQATVQRLGAQGVWSSSGEAFVAKAAAAPPSLVLIDVGTPNIDIPAIVSAAREAVSKSPKPVSIVAYGSHVLETALAAAEEAGCDAVLPRGQFHAQLDAILSRYLVDSQT